MAADPGGDAAAGVGGEASASGTASLRARAALTIAEARGCSLGCSAAAARASSSSSLRPGLEAVGISASSGTPRVRVPVLSKASCVVVPSCSITTADLASTPWRPAVAIAASSGGMVARTTAQGEATIMKVIARSSARCSWSPASNGTANTAIVAATMPIEYRCSTFSMNKLGAGLGSTGRLDQRRDAGDHGVLGASVDSNPQGASAIQRPREHFVARRSCRPAAAHR